MELFLIDILLAGDNAVVIGMAAVNWLRTTKRSRDWGTVGAIVMRLVFASSLGRTLTLIPLIH